MLTFEWPVRVYYEDTDSGGVVYYANYLKFMERARTEWLRDLGFEQDRLRDGHGVLFAVHRCAIEYHRPARFNDELIATAAVKEYRRTALTFEQSVRRGDEILTRGEIRVVCMDADTFRPKPIPEPMLTMIQRLITNDGR